MIAMMVIAAASAGVQQHQANKARDASQDAAAEQEKLAKEAEANQLQALEEQMEQESDATEVAKLDRKRQALRERAKIRVAASESGAFGNSTLKELSASMIGEGYDIGILDYNLRARSDQLSRQGKATSINTKRDIANQKASIPLSTPTWMQGLNIGLAGAGGAASGAAMSNPFPSAGAPVASAGQGPQGVTGVGHPIRTGPRK
jgi:Mrp family chromosome partitioning ATPase